MKLSTENARFSVCEFLLLEDDIIESVFLLNFQLSFFRSVYLLELSEIAEALFSISMALINYLNWTYLLSDKDQLLAFDFQIQDLLRTNLHRSKHY